jgi:hypothetical protein
MSSLGLNAAIPDETDEGGQVITFPHSHSLSRNWVSTEYQRKSPRSWVSWPQKQRDVWSRVDEAHSPDMVARVEPES